MASPASLEIITFAEFEVKLASKELCRKGVRVRLPDQSFQILAMLLERAGELVTREEIRKRLWPGDTFVDFDHGLNNAVNRLRDALGDAAESPRFIETLPRRGYRFIGAITPCSQPRTSAVLISSQRAEGKSANSRHPARRIAALVTAPLALVVGLAILNYSHLPASSGRARPPASKIMLAVLPFENLSGDPQQEYFSDGFTEEVITQLGSLQPQQLGVIARTSAMQYKKTSKPTKQIARELGVAYLLEGAVRHEGGRVLINAQLVEVKNGTELWARSYESNEQDVLSLQRDVAGAIARQVESYLLPGMRAHVAKTRVINSEAYQSYLKGRYFWNQRSQEGLTKAVALFQHATAEQPDYAQAYSGLSDAYALLGTWPNAKISRAEAMARAHATALKALEIDDTLAEAHASLASVSMIYDWNWPVAEKEFQRAMELDPDYATAHHWYAYFCASQGRWTEAIHEIRLAQQLEPLSLIINADAAEILWESRRDDEAIEQAKKTLEIDPNFAPAHQWLGLALLAKQQYSKSIAELETAVRLSRGRPDIVANLGVAYAQAGKPSQAIRILRQLKAGPSARYDSLLAIAWIHAALGQRDQAFAWADRVYPSRDIQFYLLKVFPLADPLRSDPRFPALIRRIGLPA